MKSTLKTLTAWLLFLTLFTTILPCTVLAADTPYEISTAEELWQFARRVNAGQSDLDAILIADIVFNENVLNENGALTSGDFDSWEPIGTDWETAYSGTFDGNDKTISGLYFHDEWTSYVGLFGYIKDGTVKNVHIKDSYFYGDAFIGGLVGCVESGLVIDCSSSATVESGSDYVGGIAGANMPTIGGVVGLNCATYETSSATVTNCYNTGWVDSYDNLAGGIVGMNKADQDSPKATIENCYNTGKLTVRSEIAGGIVGENNAWFNSATASIKNCFNIGAIPDYDNCGGIAGINNRFYDSATASITNCYYLDDNRFVLGGINGSDEPGFAEAKKTEQFASGEVAYLLGVPFGQNLDNGFPVQAFPVLSEERVYHYLEGYSNHPYGFVVLDESYQNLTVHVDEAGTYSVIFAHYDADGVL